MQSWGGPWALFFALLALMFGCGVVGGVWAQNQVGVWQMLFSSGFANSKISPMDFRRLIYRVTSPKISAKSSMRFP
jgi:hypothetical protein